MTRLRVLPLVLAFASFALVARPAAAPDETTAELQSRFDRETNSVHKAKALEKLADAQIRDARAAQQSNDFATVGFVWEKFRNNVRAALSALEKQHPNAEKQSNGYRQLEITTRLGIREIDQTIIEAPDPYKPPLNLVRKDLSSMDDEMLKLLFPRRVSDQAQPQPAEKPQ
ncbi:MAG TPA: hypothetical protein VJP87_01455 [Candidatus Acidoferrales bacterium]|nr:hypothetical protein [Candidatus Acidoferrales bacterium]